MADLPDSLTDTHDHPGLFQLVQGTLAGLRASGKRSRYLHDGEADKQNPVAVLGSPCQDFIQQAGVHDLDGVSVLVLITASVLVSGIVILKRNPKDILSEMS